PGTSARLGTMVGADPREPCLLPGGQLYPLAAQQRILARGACSDSGREQLDDRQRGEFLRPAGAPYVCDVPPHGGGPGPGVLQKTPPSSARSPARCRASAPSRSAETVWLPLSGNAGCGKKACGPPRNVRTLFASSRRASLCGIASVDPGQGNCGQLADQRVGPHLRDCSDASS